ncbi:hypothetical protein NMF47_00435|uniref:hypothetical protein n=1 Tax=Serratia nevei TaxID=2703794 RepID=UPI0027E4A9A6|nr:hypothetical protein [Serratia nevei]MDQ7766961.1 hypothetical protein [Serratia nevei]
MTTIQRFTPDYKMHAVRFEAFAREAEHGELVQFDAHLQTVSALESERDALAVENVALKDVFGPGEAVVNFLSIALRHTKYDCIDLPDVALAFKMSLPETPATDAALAAIEARGVEKAAAALDALSAQSASATTQGNFRAAAVYLRTTVLPAIWEAK